MSNNRTVKLGGGKKKGVIIKSRPVRQVHSQNQNNNTHRGSASGNKTKRNEYQKIIVSPIPSTADRTDLMNFLKTRSYRPNANFVNTQYRDQRLYISIEKPEDVHAIVGLSGIRYNSIKLEIVRDSNVRDNKPPIKNEIILRERLAAAQRMKIFEDHLNASYVNNPNKEAVDFSFIQGSNPTLNFNDDKLYKQLFRVLADKCPKAITVSFASNSISTLASFQAMLRYSLDHIINFDFSNNKISDLSELDYLSNLSLRELVFTGNPITQSPTYRMEVARRFPDLQILDSKPISQEDFPPSPIPPLRANFTDSVERQAFAYKFLHKYMTAFDKERRTIVNAYSKDSHFSMTFQDDNTSKGKTKNIYKRSNRNLKKNKDSPHNFNLLLHGSENINNFFKLYPATSHYLQSSTIDTFLAPGSSALIIVMHGHYLETLFNAKRSYDRTFILAPAAPGSNSANNGWEATILNEQLVVRSYLRFPRLEPQPNLAQPQIPEVNQDALISQFTAATNLKPEFARECLSNNSWDINKAMEVFQNLLKQNGIPQNYYI